MWRLPGSERLILSAVAIVLLLGKPALSVESAAETLDLSDLPPVLIVTARRGLTVEQYLAQVLKPLRSADLDRDGLDQQDIDDAESVALAGARASQVGRILAHDLDNDGRVTRDEALRAAGRKKGLSIAGTESGGISSPERDRVEKQIDKLMQSDSNGDGTIDFDEMRSVQERSARRTSAKTNSLRQLLALDPNQDGRLTSQELSRLAQDTFARIDRDGDGVISSAEDKSLMSARKTAMAAAKAGPCTVPKPSVGSQVVLTGVYEGQGLSTVAVAGPDRVTTTATITVESGEAPLYILLTSYDAMVWQFDGAVERVSQVVVASRGNSRGVGAGVTGVPRERVSFIAPGTCFGYFHEVESDKAKAAHASIKQAIGRDVDRVNGIYGAWRVSLPSGRNEKAVRPRSVSPPQGVDPTTWQALYRFSPGGIVEFDPATIVSPAPVDRYDVLPQQAGLAQLLQEGSLERRKPGVYHIVRPIARFPAGLAGAHSVKFVLAEGLPMPAGSPGHSCVRSGEDGSVLSGRGICR
ncbi:MAG: hypothetical protein AAF495_10450 [Pseudomonadota bacterium]